MRNVDDIQQLTLRAEDPYLPGGDVDLSLAVHRREINQVIYFGLVRESNNTVLPDSPLYKPEYQDIWAEYDPAEACVPDPAD